MSPFKISPEVAFEQGSYPSAPWPWLTYLVIKNQNIVLELLHRTFLTMVCVLIMSCWLATMK